ncbi:hypothetical protein GX553_02345 [Candidatus Peribacteria bacterium]|nr:hypothetical protein [Candidatus Peribacteria bacterium]
MRRMFRFALVSFLCFPGIVAAATVPFPDTEGTWFRYRESIAALQERGILEGYPDGTFRPKQTLNRAELLKIIFKGRSDVVPVQRRCFSDVNPDAWYAPYVCAAQRRGIVQGYSGGVFRPEQPVNTAEAVKMMLLAYGRQIDEPDGEHWYVPYTASLDETGILARSSYLPWSPLSRERAADLLYRVLRYDEDRTLLSRSAGCGTAYAAAPGTLQVQGRQRTYELNVPKQYQIDMPAPLILAFHGRTNSAAQVRAYYGLDRAASDAFIAYPAAMQHDTGTYHWSDPGDRAGELRDIAYFDALVEDMANRYCIDLDRIFVAGHSLGGWFANSVACIRGDVVRASASVGGSSVITECAGPSAALIAHNPNDRMASFTASELTRDLRLEVNACPADASPAQLRSLQCVQYVPCSAGNPVLWCPHEQDYDPRGNYYPHTWPTDFGDTIARFFASLD